MTTSKKQKTMYGALAVVLLALILAFFAGKFSDPQLSAADALAKKDTATAIGDAEKAADAATTAAVSARKAADSTKATATSAEKSAADTADSAKAAEQFVQKVK